MDRLQRFLETPAARGHGIGLLIFAVLQGLGTIAPTLPRDAFCRPAAHLVSWFLHAPVVSRTEEAIHLLHHHLEIAVTLSCSGFGYYSLLAALCLGRYFGTHPFCPLRGLMFLTSLWALALGANAARIICAVYARLWASSFLPSAYQESLHLMVGISVFLFSLITIWILFPRFVR